MIKKSRILSLLLILIPLLVAIGFSSWIIIYEVIFSPTYSPNPVSSMFPFTDSDVYNGYEQVPEPLNEKDVEGYTISYQYILEGTDEPIDGKPIDAGVYDVIVTLTESDGDEFGSCKIKYTIEPLKIKASEYSLTVKDLTTSTWKNFYTYVNGKISFTDSNGKTLANNLKPQYSLTTMTNNDSNCSFNEDNDAIVPGSTYILNMTLQGKSSYNYALYDVGGHYLNSSNNYGINGSCIVKYKSVYLGDDTTTFYTIEDAISSGGNIVLYGSTSTFITAFSNFGYYKKDNIITLNSSSNLWITYNGTKTAYNAGSGSNIVYSVLFIPEGVTLIANGTINVCASVSNNSHTVTTRGVLFNNGQIDLYGTLYSYGFTNGAGTINANGNSIVYDILKFYNYSSGGPMLLMSNANIFPITCYSMHNISCQLKLMYTAKFMAPYNIDIGIDVTGELVLIGDNGLFDLSNGYVIKKVEDTTSNTYSNKSLLSNYNVSNQNITQREVIEVYGEFTDNIISLTANYMGQTKGIQTGKNYAMPIGFMNISLKDDGKGNVGIGNMKNNSYKFLPGSRLQIDEGCSISIAADLNIIFYDENYQDTFTFDPNLSGHTPESISYRTHHSAWFSSTRNDIGSQFIVNGNCEVSGKLGGYIQTTSDTGFISLSNTSATLPKLSSMKYEGGTTEKLGIVLGTTKASTINETVIATGNINKVDNSTFTAAPYISMLSGNTGYWAIASSAKQFTLNFYDYNEEKQQDEQIYTKKVYVIDPAEDGNYYYTVKGTEYTPSKMYYNFSDWYVEISGVKHYVKEIYDKELSTDPITKLYDSSTNADNSITLHASWTEIGYSFQYMFGYEDSSTGNIIPLEPIEVTLSNSNGEFKYSDIKNSSITITTEAEYNGKVFNGWYYGLDNGGNKLGKIFSIDNFNAFIQENSNSTKIQLYALFTDYEVFTINLVDNNENFTYTTLGNKTTLDSISLPDMSEFDNIISATQYFDGWYIDSNTSTEVLSLSNNVGYIVQLIEEYNKTATEANKINLENGVITLYAKCPTKKSVEFYKGTSLNQSLGVNDGVVLAATYWYKPGGSVSFPEPNVNEQGHTFKGWATTNVTDGTFKYASCSVITVAELENNNITKLYASYTVNSYKVTIESNSKINSVKSGSTSITSGTTISYGITLTINIDNVGLTSSTYNCNIYNSKNEVIYSLTSNKALFGSGTTNGTYVFLACDDITIKVG